MFEQREELCAKLTADVQANREWLMESLEYPLAGLRRHQEFSVGNLPHTRSLRSEQLSNLPLQLRPTRIERFRRLASRLHFEIRLRQQTPILHHLGIFQGRALGFK